MQIKKYQKSKKARTGIKLGRKGRKRVTDEILKTNHIPWLSQVLNTRKTVR